MLCKYNQLSVLNLSLDEPMYKTFAFVEVHEEMSEGESRKLFDNLKRPFQLKVSNEIAKPEVFIVSHNK